MPEPIYVSAREAAAELNISRATLYAYVSRGLIESIADPGARTRQYALADVRALRRGAVGADAQVGQEARALDFGAPLLDSRLTTIRDGRLYYLGRDAAALSQTASFQSVTGLLWDTSEPALFAAAPSLDTDSRDTDAGIPGAVHRLTRAASLDPRAHGRSKAAIVGAGAAIVQIIGTAFGADDAEDEGSGGGGGSMEQRLARGWAAPKAAPAIRAALILAADHELNASTFVVRCVASTGASPYNAVIAGLAALQGPRHGGQTLQVAAFFNEAERAASPEQAVADRLARGDPLPGFGHRLYPNGDIRAATILAAIETTGGGPAALTFANGILQAVRSMTGELPNIDFALVVLARAFGLPAIAPLGIFATGRSAGWIAHAQEQYADSRLIRPRARYTGEPPRPAHQNRLD